MATLFECGYCRTLSESVAAARSAVAIAADSALGKGSDRGPCSIKMIAVSKAAPTSATTLPISNSLIARLFSNAPIIPSTNRLCSDCCSIFGEVGNVAIVQLLPSKPLHEKHKVVL